MPSNPEQVIQAPLTTTEHEGFSVRSVPIFINVRDRLQPLIKLLDWLNRAGHENVILVNVASSYPPLLKFLDTCPYRVVNLKRNLGKYALWRISTFRQTIDTEWFVYTDSDVVPTETCPLDAVVYFYHLLQRFPNYLKAGFGLCLHDLPDQYHQKQKVLQWESGLYGRELAPGVFQADIDTTFALYRPHAAPTAGPAMRTRGLYEARHTPWYIDSANPDKEEIYYQVHARSATRHWRLNREPGGKSELPPIAGGIAARIESDPRAVLTDLLSSKTGKALFACRLARRLAGKPIMPRDARNYTSAAEIRRAILEILTSDEWRTALNITTSLRQLKYMTVRWRQGQK